MAIDVTTDEIMAAFSTDVNRSFYLKIKDVLGETQNIFSGGDGGSRTRVRDTCREISTSLVATLMFYQEVLGRQRTIYRLADSS
jgi:hypothetical protein